MNVPSFDALKVLFQSDPVAFESLRAELIEREIGKASAEGQRRLRGLQFQIDAIRRTSRTPLACCVLIQQMLHHKAGELLAMLSDSYRPTPHVTYQDNILPFRDRNGYVPGKGSTGPDA